MHAVPYLPYAYERLARAAGGGDTVHWLFVAGAARWCWSRRRSSARPSPADPALLARRSGRRPRDRGRDGGQHRGQHRREPRRELLVHPQPRDGRIALRARCCSTSPPRSWCWLDSDAGRAPTLVGAGSVVVAVALAFGGVRVDQAIAGREIDAASLAEYRAELARRAATQTFVAEGRSSIVTVYERPGSRLLRTDGLPEAGFQYSPPYFSLSSVLLGVVPYLAGGGAGARPRDRTRRRQHAARAGRHPAPGDRRGGARTEGGRGPRGAPSRARESARGSAGAPDPGRRTSPPGAQRERRAGSLRRDRIAAEPSVASREPRTCSPRTSSGWSRASLTDGGCFALWINGFSMDPESLLAVVASFERVFPGSQLVDASKRGRRDDLLLVGGRHPLRADARRARRAPRRAAARRPPRALRNPGGPRSALVLRGPRLRLRGARTRRGQHRRQRLRRDARPARGCTSACSTSRHSSAASRPRRRCCRRSAGGIDPAAVAEALLARAPDGVPFPFASKLERLLRAARRVAAAGAPRDARGACAAARSGSRGRGHRCAARAGGGGAGRSRAAARAGPAPRPRAG